ncbi:hypothetical protein NW768_011095 [Fusarium equiseti]|uniref:Uncharacterized protein n=1 Tax=Fusarium equiseti TaxID=61235 RepID=A0ABQ8QYH9_FUSEQ|nr:hypothetical protein NW768_011095 [Fusarium equiseti]
MEAPGPAFTDRSVNMTNFFNLSDTVLLRQIQIEFSADLNRLTRAYSIRERNVQFPSQPSPSEILYGAQHDEVNRTLVSVLSLRWIYWDRYETFKESQPEGMAISRSSFKWLRELFMPRLQDPSDLYALLTYIVINDVGKDPELATDYRSHKDKDISNLNHDMILFEAVKASLVPSFERLAQRHKDEIMRGMKLGAEFNPGQLAQAENAPACLSSLLLMEGHIEDFNFHFIQQLLDISGAAGHEDWTCAKKLIEPIATAYHNVYEVAIQVISRERGLRDAYDFLLTRRGEMLHQKDLKLLDVQHPEHRALLRLLSMGGVSDLKKAQLYLQTWKDLDEDTKTSLIRSLNIDGSLSEPAVQPTYIPAMLTQGVGGLNSASAEEQAKRLRYILRYLSRVMDLGDEQHDHAAVIERSVLWVVKDVVQCDAFRQDPTCLEKVEIPKSVILVSVGIT